MKIYVASKTKHAVMWKVLRHHWSAEGIDIISTWIDEAGEGDTPDFTDLWFRCFDEISRCDALIAYHEPGDVWKGAYAEIGAAIANQKPVYFIGQPPGTLHHHQLVITGHDPMSVIDYAQAAHLHAL
jgi:hypothetical protein